MKGVMFTRRGVAELIDEPTPTCSPDTVLLRTLYSGLSNGTERSFLVGGNYGGFWPSRLAYQQVSEVIECGSEITRFAVGDIVYTGTYPGHVEYHTARETDLIIKLPKGVEPLDAALFGVAAVSFHDAQRARVRPDDKVLVLGDGLIGQFAAQAARVMGAHVTLAGHHDDRLVLGKELGADVVINNRTPEGEEQIRAGAPYSVIFECSGGDVLDFIIGTRESKGILARRSHTRLVMVAGRFDVKYSFNQAGNAELDILHTQHFDPDDLAQLVRLVQRGDISTRPLIRDVVPLEEAPRIFDALRDNKSSLLGTVFAVGAEQKAALNREEA